MFHVLISLLLVAENIFSLLVTPAIQVSLEDILDRKHLPPLTLREFEDYLLFVERSSENLFVLLSSMLAIKIFINYEQILYPLVSCLFQQVCAMGTRATEQDALGGAFPFIFARQIDVLLFAFSTRDQHLCKCSRGDTHFQSCSSSICTGTHQSGGG